MKAALPANPASLAAPIARVRRAPSVQGLEAVGVTLSMLTPASAFAQAKPSKAQQMQTQAVAEIPHCARKLGTGKWPTKTTMSAGC